MDVVTTARRITEKLHISCATSGPVAEMTGNPAGASPLQALIVVRFPAAAEILSALLTQNYPGARIVVREHFQSATELLKHSQFNIVIADIYSCDGNLHGLEAISAHSGAARTVFFDLEHDQKMSHTVRLLNADAYVPWTTPTRSIEAIISGVMAGTPYFEIDRISGAFGTAHQDAGKIGLTPRQIEVHRLLERGASNKDIAQTLGMAPATVKIHVNAILKTLKVKNRTEAAVYFQMKQNLCRSCTRLQVPAGSGRLDPSVRSDCEPYDEL